MTYVLMHVDLTGLGPAEAGTFMQAAAELGLDVIDLAPDMAIDAEATVLISTSLAALISKLAGKFGDGAGEKLWDRRHPGRHYPLLGPRHDAVADGTE